MTDKLLTEDDYNKILQVRLNHTNFKFRHGEMKPISENSEGFMGDHYKLKVTYEQADASEAVEYFFLKTKPASNTIQESCADELNIYEREIFMYDVLLKEFGQLGYDISFSAKCYHCVPGTTLVFQDVTLDQYELSERTKPFDLDQIQALLTSLAMFHGAGFAHERSKTKELGRPFKIGEDYEDMLKEPFYVSYLDRNKMSMDWWNSTFVAMDKLIDVISIDEAKKEKLRQLIKDAEFGKIFATETSFAKTCGHGDLWSNNMMFKRSENGATKCCLVDFQLGRYFYPAFDVILAIFFNTTTEYRKDHLSELYQFYYDTLGQILQNYGYSIADILPLDEFHKTIKMLKYEALLQIIGSHMFIYMPKETLTDFAKNDDASMQDAMFGDKYKMALELYKSSDIFKKIMTDNIIDIYEALLANQN